MKAINKEIFRLAVPSILANITVPLVGFVDTIIAGHLGTSGLGSSSAVNLADAEALASGAGSGLGAAAFLGSIAIGSMLFDMLYWNFSFLRAGTSGLTAQAFGRGDKAECSSNLNRALLSALGISLLILAFQWPFCKLLLAVIPCSPEVAVLAERYFFIRIWAAPATLSLFAFRGWFIGMQDSFSSMFIDVIVLIVNALASFLLVFGWGGGADAGLLGFKGIGFDGIAWGTVLAQYAGLTYAIIRCITHYGRSHFAGWNFREAFNTLLKGRNREFNSLNSGIFFHSLALMVIYVGTTSISAYYGDLLLASTSIVMKLMLLFSYFTDGFAFAGEALTGRYIGSRDSANLHATVRWTFIWSLAISLAFVGLNGILATPMFRMMTSDPSVIAASGLFIPWLIVMPLLGCPAFTWDGMYIGAAAAKDVCWSAVASAVAFFVVWFAGNGIVSMSMADISAPVVSGDALAEITSKRSAQELGISAKNLASIHILFAAYLAHLLVRTLWLTVRAKKSVLSKA